jgi:cysteine desulfurase/selenocysteine lyase
MTPRAAASLRAVRHQGAFDVDAIRRDFPILRQFVRGRPLVYLDNAATTQKPRAVIEALTRFYTEDNANVHRGVHLLSERATAAFEDARRTVQRFLGAGDEREIVFVRGATEGINLVAQSWGRSNLKPGDEVLISALEHHSNIVPWQLICGETGATLKVIPISDDGEILMEEFDRLLTPRTKLVAVVHVSNALGTITPVAEIVRRAHARDVPVLVDGAQAVSHLPVDVGRLDCDFYVFSGHKVYGPTGIGVLYGKSRLLESMPPYQGGGDMISSVTFERTDYNRVPYRFEAGTPDIAGAIGMAAALDYVSSLGMDRVGAHERELLDYATRSLAAVPGVRIVGHAAQRAAIVSFVMDGIHPHDIGTIVDGEGVAIRTGHHCCQPLMHRLGLDATARASFALYNTAGEIDALADALNRVREVFA